MRSILKKYWPLVLILSAFIAIKVPYLFFPSYWDEEWSYIPAVHAMFTHGPTLLPGALAADISRGHPLFFYAVVATWMKVFGSSLIAQHIFALFIAALQLSAVYIVCHRLFNKRVAVAAAILLAAQVMFFVQSTMVLPEILIGLLAFVTIYFYIANKFFATFICLSILFLTKESGLVVGLLLGADAVVTLFKKQASPTLKWKKLATVCTACGVISVFFLLQCHAYGWFLFPAHTAIIDYSWPAVFGKLRSCFTTLFADSMICWGCWLLLALSVVVAIWKKKFLWLLYLLPAAAIWLLVTSTGSGLVSQRLLLFAVAASLAVIISGGLLTDSAPGKKLLLFGGMFFMLYVTFCAFNFLTPRYLIAALVWVIVFIAVWLDRLAAKTSFYLYIPISMLLVFNTCKAFQYSTSMGDCDLHVFDAMMIQKDMVRYLEDKQMYSASIGAGSFLQRVAMQDPAAGFLKQNKTFAHVNWIVTDKTNIDIFDNVCNDEHYQQVKTDTGFIQVYRTSHGVAWGEIYVRKAAGNNK